MSGDATLPLWSPPAEPDTELTKFLKLIEEKYHETFGDYHALYRWTVRNVELFWKEFWEYSHILFSKNYEEVVDLTIPMKDIPEWFKGARLNAAENLLQFKSDAVAIFEANEFTNEVKTITFNQLNSEVSLLSRSFHSIGVDVGDKVVGYLPNSMFAVKAMLSAVTLGAVWSCASPDFGVQAVVERFSQIRPKVLVTVNKVMYNGKMYPLLEKVKEIVLQLPSVQHVILAPHLDDVTMDSLDVPLSMTLGQFLELGKNQAPVAYRQLPFNHPMYIMYSSGTTGAPKCMVHSAGGTLLQHLKEHMLMGNVNSADIVFYYTTTGWMMWNWLVSCLAVGAAIVLYDGSPFKPDQNVLWDLVDKTGITVFGTSAIWLSKCEERGMVPKETHNLSTLRQILSTGSPLKPQSFDWVYEKVKKNVLLGSITGGTDIISLFCGHNVNLPVYRGEVQCRHLGMAVECWDQNGTPLVSQPGELVCVRPFPSMPVAFLNDPDGQKYYNAYFGKFGTVWNHGDACLICGRTGGVIMMGRSDATLNPGGVRLGSAEIYNVVEALSEVEDSLCVGQVGRETQEERVVLFLKLAEDQSLSEALASQVKSRIRQQLSARHVPAVVLQTPSIPYTVNGKKVEVAVKNILSGREVTNRNALANPEVLDWYSNLTELSDWS